MKRLADEEYVKLTTFRKSGDPVSTPVWFAGDGDDLVVWSERDSGKVKRIRNDGRVEVTACDLRGMKTHGPTVSGHARLLDDTGTDRVRERIRSKYGLLGWLSVYGSMLRGGKRRTIGIAIALDDATS